MNTDKIRALYRAAEQRMRTVNIRPLPGAKKPLLFISDTYPGLWLEHTQDADAWADLFPEEADIALRQPELFFSLQKEDGQLPCYILDPGHPTTPIYPSLTGYGQLQECVSFANFCLKAVEKNGGAQKVPDFLQRAYEGCSRWDNWLTEHRMTKGLGLVETFCAYDTGHDNSLRTMGLPGSCTDYDAKRMPEDPRLPLICPDQNAVVYGSRIALAKMAELLGRSEEAAAWRKKAEELRQNLRSFCRGEDGFYYDADAEGNKSDLRTIAVTNVIAEGVADPEEVRSLWTDFLGNPKHFYTPCPFASVSISDPRFGKRISGNDWGYYAQSHVILRAESWMRRYGLLGEYEEILQRWLDFFSANDERFFCQEMDPFTGVYSRCSEWFSVTMLLYMRIVKRLGLI